MLRRRLRPLLFASLQFSNRSGDPGSVARLGVPGPYPPTPVATYKSRRTGSMHLQPSWMERRYPTGRRQFAARVLVHEGVPWQRRRRTAHHLAEVLHLMRSQAVEGTQSTPTPRRTSPPCLPESAAKAPCKVAVLSNLLVSACGLRDDVAGANAPPSPTLARLLTVNEVHDYRPQSVKLCVSVFVGSTSAQRRANSSTLASLNASGQSVVELLGMIVSKNDEGLPKCFGLLFDKLLRRFKRAVCCNTAGIGVC